MEVEVELLENDSEDELLTDVATLLEDTEALLIEDDVLTTGADELVAATELALPGNSEGQLLVQDVVPPLPPPPPHAAKVTTTQRTHK